MANKRIQDLTTRSSFDETVYVPVDDSTQSWKTTGQQILDFIMSKLTALTAVTPAAGDYIPIVDASDSNAAKKVLFSDFKNSAYRSVVTTDTVLADDGTMKLSGASFTSTLLTAVGRTGKRYAFVHGGTSGTQVYTIATTSSQTIGGYTGGTITLVTNGETLVVESDGANWMIISRRGKLPVLQIFTADGTYTPTAGMTKCYAWGVGGGGGGGGAANLAGGAGGGGGAGGVSADWFTKDQIGASKPVTIGSAAAGGTAGNNAGTNGTDVSLGSLLVAKGASGGPGSAGSATAASVQGGAGGIAGTGTFTAPGATGGSGYNQGGNTIAISGFGGSSPRGGGASAKITAGSGATTGGTATGNGAGGSGGAQTGTSNVAGGPGSKGLLEVTDFFD